MKDLTLNKEQIELLINLTHFESVEIVWDLNAFYINSNLKTYKLECFAEKPLGSDYQYDEIFYCQFMELKKHIEFDGKDTKYWHKIISKDCKIIGIKYLNVMELFPEDILIPIENYETHKTGLNKSTLGLIIETNKGFIPAFLLPSNHGFSWHKKFEFYSKTEITELINENIKHYEIKNCA